jgi:hypothetical protein
MRPRVALGPIVVLSLLLAGCGAAAADDPAPAAPAARSVAARAGAAPGSCPTTRPPDPAFVPPAPYPPRPPSVEDGKVWYGTDELWTWLRADGTWPMAHDRHGLFDKSFWWRQGYDWTTETTPRLRVTGRRLDGPAPTFTSSPATNGFEPSMGAFMLVGLELPTGGCWELTGHYHGRSLRFVVRVLRWQP